MLKYPSRDRILRDLTYVKERGTFIRRSTGRDASTMSNGYPVICIGGQQYPRAHLVWIMETGAPPERRLRRRGAPDDTRFSMLFESYPVEKKAPVTTPRRVYGGRLGPWNNELDNAALERLAAWRERTGVSFDGISDVMTLRLLDPGEDA